MSDMLKAFFTDVEDFAKKMKEHSIASNEQTFENNELIANIVKLTERVDKLLNLIEGNLGTAIQVAPEKSRRMMNIKKRILDIINENPKGVRPPQIARALGTKVQNLYPHLKMAVANNTIKKDKTGTYFPAKVMVQKAMKTK